MYMYDVYRRYTKLSMECIHKLYQSIAIYIILKHFSENLANQSKSIKIDCFKAWDYDF